MSMLELGEERTFSEAQFDANELTKPLAAGFTALRADWLATFMLEIEQMEAHAFALARVLAVDADLDVLHRVIINTLKIATDDKRSSKLFGRFVGKERPVDQRRPILGPQAELMEGWLRIMHEKETPDELNAYIPRLETLIARAKEAAAALTKADEAQEAFGTTGAKKTLVDKFNAVRKEAHGQAGKIPHERPELNLSNDFAEQFFLRETRSASPTVESQTKVVEQLTTALDSAKQRLDGLKAERKAREQALAAAIEEEEQQEADDLERTAAEMLEKAAAIRAKKGKTPV